MCYFLCLTLTTHGLSISIIFLFPYIPHTAICFSGCHRFATTFLVRGFEQGIWFAEYKLLLTSVLLLLLSSSTVIITLKTIFSQAFLIY
ncbi:hypothetical protein F4678DRAFT_449293 [Xylaria arbuscula]|nr:hypothetical protein F4678DRAFT_449293 [Xylaria arbuscula]